MTRRYAARRDANHSDIVDALRSLGIGVKDCGSFGDGFCDIVAVLRGQAHFIEIKDGAKKPSARELTKDQQEFQAFLRNHGSKLHVVENVQQACAIFGVRL